MEKADFDYLAIGAGWYPIVDNLFSTIYEKVFNAKYWATFYDGIEDPAEDVIARQEKFKTILENAVADLPVIQQIKEKFGQLRVYVDNADDRIYGIINMAEKVSVRTCEKCGKAGYIRQDLNWLKVLCDEHYEAQLKAQQAWQSERKSRTY